MSPRNAEGPPWSLQFGPSLLAQGRELPGESAARFLRSCDLGNPEQVAAPLRHCAGERLALGRTLGVRVGELVVRGDASRQRDASFLQPVRWDDFVDDSEFQRARRLEQSGAQGGFPPLS